MPQALDPDARRVARGELIGRLVTIAASTDPSLVGLEGRVVDETRETFLVRAADGRDRLVAKAPCRFTFATRDGQVEIDGDRLRFRPEDRIKRIR